MAGEIKHKFTGTVLTITSDSGTSSVDLKGAKGDRGVRGVQGRAGVIMKEDGTVDMSGYATEEYVEDLVNSIETTVDVDLSNYYTKDEIDATISNLPTGGGGGGTGNGATLTLTNALDWLGKSFSEVSKCNVSATWSSIEDGIATGTGILTVTVNSVLKYTSNIPQGTFTVDVTDWLNVGTNSIKVSVTDVYGNKRSIVYTVNVVSLRLTSNFDSSVAYEGAISYTYVPTGDVKKTIYFKLDGVQIGTANVASTGRQQMFTIPAQSHGAHRFEVYFTAVFDGEVIESNHLVYDLICIESGNNTPIISCAIDSLSCSQYETVNIPYYVYTPNSMTSQVTLKVDGETFNELTVDRTQQTWAYRADDFGDMILSIACGDVISNITLIVTETTIDVEAVTESLDLYLSSYGRDNNEANPDRWVYVGTNKVVGCTFYNYNWKTDGWQIDDDGITCHRVTGDARLRIPLEVFKTDFRSTGKTIEFEFATREVKNYDSVIVSCMQSNVGFEMTAQKATLKSAQSEISTQYKEDEHIRLTFVVEKRAENRLIYIYLNGIMCGVTQYPDDDDFTQGVAVPIQIGSNDCTIDLYNIRVYSNNLSQYEVLDNWIADTQVFTEKLARYERNDIYDSYGNIVIDKLPKDLPYLVLEAPSLPTYKGNKLNVNGSYVNPIEPEKDFTFNNAEADVQGTSSAGYARKNYKIKFKNGITQNDSRQTNYAMREDSIPTNMFTFKADVASSEGANNVELVRLYDRISPYKTPPQLANPSVRQGIDGFPIVIFHNDGTNTSFIGKYNFNNDKGTPEVFGFATGDESWEIRNNTSDRVIWKNDDFSTDDWKNDFEARYPEDNVDVTNLQRFSTWVKSTDTEAATDEALTESVTYGDVEYTNDTAEYRLAKFVNEIEDYAELDSALFYYLFTELFLMVDSRAKNAFPSMIGGDKICWLPYDMDTANGTNNEGDLVFGYELEDIDTTPTGADVYNGQQSVFWKNIRNGFYDELAAMYQSLRSTGALSYDVVENAYEEHQNKWCEAIWNEDAYYKYIEPLINDGANIYLPMLQGSKEEQRKWWLYNRFRYIDSKYVAGDSLSDFITLRGYAKSDITVTPYADIYAAIKYGSYMVTERALKGRSYILECPLDSLNDTEIYIYSASQLEAVGDLSGLKVGLADFSAATKLQTLKVGSNDEGYTNPNLTSLTVGNNVLLNHLDVRNCTNFGTGEQKSLDVSGCTNIERIFLEGTALKSVSLPESGMLKTLHLPDTLTSLKICNQPNLIDFQLSSFENITSLRLENIGFIDTKTALMQMQENGRVRMTDIEWTFEDYEEATAVLGKLDTMRGLDEHDNNTENAQVSGVINIPWQCVEFLDEWESKYPTITFNVSKFDIGNATWEEIAQISESGNASKIMSVGDSKTIELSDGEIITAVIYGFNHDSLNETDSSTGEYKKAGITFGLKNCVETDSAFATSNSGIWRSALRSTIVTYFNKMPTDLQQVIKTVRKAYSSESISESVTGTEYRHSVSTTTETLFAFAHIEIMGTRHATARNDFGSLESEGEQYEYFKNARIPSDWTPLNEGATTGTFRTTTLASMSFTDRFGNVVTKAANTYSPYYNYNASMGKGNNASSPVSYWTRSIERGQSFGTKICIGTEPKAAGDTWSDKLGVLFGFCI